MTGRRGFSLIELLVVLTLIALVSATVAVSVREPYRRARLEDALERMAASDQQARDRACRLGRSCRLVYDLDRNEVQIADVPSTTRPWSSLRLGRAVRLDRLLQAGNRRGSGRTPIGVSPQGATRSYAVRVRAGTDRPVWLFFCGISGQMTRFHEDSHVEAVLEQLAQERAVAD